jgi:large conductance mechanosensitive channel
MLNEFKQFIARGNVMDMAVGIIIGAAFTGIVTSLVGDLIMPIVGVATSGVDFGDLFLSLDGQFYASLKEAQANGAPLVMYGNFINALVNFLIVAFVVFMLVKGVNSLKRKEEAAPEKPSAPSQSEALLAEIRDALIKQKPVAVKAAAAKVALPKKVVSKKVASPKKVALKKEPVKKAVSSKTKK